MRSWSRWLIFAPVAVLALFAPVAKADSVQGLDTLYYAIDEIPPLQADGVYELCGSELENNINRSYDGEPFEDCTGDMFMVHMTGFIEIPEHETIEFWLASDDGGVIDIGGNAFGVWQDQGCSATFSGELDLEAGSIPLNLWMYENGGGTCLMLAWKIDDGYWEIVPDSAFTTMPVVSTTTTVEATTSTGVSTTTVVVSTSVESTTSLAPQTTVPVSEPTMPEQSSTTTSTTTSSSVPQGTTTTEPVSPPVAQPPVVVQPEPIEVPTIEDTVPSPIVTEPVEETLPLDLPETDPTVYPSDTLPFVDDLLEEKMPPPAEEGKDADGGDMATNADVGFDDTTMPDATETQLLVDELLSGDVSAEEFVAAVEDLLADGLSAEEFDGLVEALDMADLSDEQVLEVVDAILAKPLSQEQSVSVASSSAVLSVVSGEQAEAIFEQISVGELSAEEGEAIVDAVQDAPSEVKKAFEAVVNLFDGVFDSYVALGSTIPMSARRTLVVAGATIMAAAATPQTRRGRV